MDAGWRLLFGSAALAALFFAMRRVRTIKRLCDHGVEVEAHLLRVWDSQGSETDFRHADYAYEYGGRSYEFTVRGVDFFMSFATRYGERVRVLLDPEQPRDFSDPRDHVPLEKPRRSLERAEVRVRDGRGHLLPGQRHHRSFTWTHPRRARSRRRIAEDGPLPQRRPRNDVAVSARRGLCHRGRGGE